MRLASQPIISFCIQGSSLVYGLNDKRPVLEAYKTWRGILTSVEKSVAGMASRSYAECLSLATTKQINSQLNTANVYILHRLMDSFEIRTSQTFGFKLFDLVCRCGPQTSKRVTVQRQRSVELYLSQLLKGLAKEVELHVLAGCCNS